eukprot:scaffold399626_cov19-Prasinocladus_malaysianus.AAC.1
MGIGPAYGFVSTRALNVVTKSLFAYPTLKPEELLGKVAQAQIFSTSDNKFAFHTLPIACQAG